MVRDGGVTGIHGDLGVVTRLAGFVAGKEKNYTATAGKRKLFCD